jgi:hypothetical protein
LETLKGSVELDTEDPRDRKRLHAVTRENGRWTSAVGDRLRQRDARTVRIEWTQQEAGAHDRRETLEAPEVAYAVRAKTTDGLRPT